MHASTQELLAYLERNRAALQAAVGRVPVEQRQARPAPDRWSTAEILEHLAIVEKRVAGRLSDALAAGKANGDGAANDIPAFDERFARRLRNRLRRMVTSQPNEPTGTLDIQAAWAELEKARTAVVDLVHESDGLPLADPLAPHPVFGSLTFRQWIVFLGGHEARHADQIVEIATGLNA